MLKKDIKAVFQAIRRGSLPEVEALIRANSDLLHACNFAPPKKDDGQSTLQVALKTGDFQICRFLIAQGADVNFIEKSELNEWKAPVLHDCIRAVLFNCYTLNREESRFEEGLDVLTILLDQGADPNAVDSYGNNCLHRALLDAKQVITHPDADLNSVLLSQVRRVVTALITAGADSQLAIGTRSSAVEFARNFGLDKHHLL